MASRMSASVALAAGLLAAAAVWGPVEVAGAQTQPQPQPAPGMLLESSNETRFQLDLHVSDDALKSYLPPGWMSNVATQGPAKDANLRAVFIDRVTINASDGKPVGTTGTNRLVYLVAPVNDANGTGAQLVVGGLTEDPTDSPGPFGNYLLAKTHDMQRDTQITGDGPIMDSQDWKFAADSGEHLELHVKYERGSAARGNPSDSRFYSAADPTLFQISRQEQVLDILRNVTTSPPDRVHEFSFDAGGGSYQPLLDGTEKVLSWDNILWINRSVYLPQ
jgi:hypothetical protein